MNDVNDLKTKIATAVDAIVPIVTNASRKTANYNLPLFTSSDKPSWLVDWNNTMTAIDSLLKEVETGSTDNKTELDKLATRVTDLEGLVQTAQNDISTNATNIATNAENITGLQNSINTIQNDILETNATVKQHTSQITDMSQYVSPVILNDGKNQGYIGHKLFYRSMSAYEKIVFYNKNTDLPKGLNDYLIVFNVHRGAKTGATFILLCHSTGNPDFPFALYVDGSVVNDSSRNVDDGHGGVLEFVRTSAYFSKESIVWENQIYYVNYNAKFDISMIDNGIAFKISTSRNSNLPSSSTAFANEFFTIDVIPVGFSPILKEV